MRHAWLTIHRSSHPDVFCKKGVLENFAKFTGKYLCQSLFLNKVAGLRPAPLVTRFWLGGGGGGGVKITPPREKRKKRKK